MLRAFPPSRREIRRVALTATRIIERCGLSCCLFGSAACSLWADIGRTPGDVDIVVMDPYNDVEGIKQLLVDNDARFFLIDSRSPFATYRVLWFRLPGYRVFDRAVKVDVLVPPTNLNLPWISGHAIMEIQRIPVMPIFGVLLMKVQGWWDHHRSSWPEHRVKEQHDLSDIRALLGAAARQGIHLSRERYNWPAAFVSRGRYYVRRLPAFRDELRALGFN